MGETGKPYAAGDESGDSAPGHQGDPLEQIARYGGGEIDPQSGYAEYYTLPSDVADRLEHGGGTPVTWELILERWALVECDLQDHGIDVGDRTLMASRSWRWLRVRIIGLCSTDSRLSRALAPRREIAGTVRSRQAAAQAAARRAWEE